MTSKLTTIIDLAKESSKSAFDRCKQSPGVCIRQVLIDAFVLIGMYSLTIYAIEGPDLFTVDYAKTSLAKYFVLYVACSFVLRYLDVDYEDALSRGAAMLIAGKMVTVMAPVPRP